MGLEQFAETFRTIALEKIWERSAGVNEWTLEAVRYLTGHWSRLLSLEGKKDQAFTLGLHLGNDSAVTVEGFVEALLSQGVPNGLKQIIATGNPKAIVPFQDQIQEADLILTAVRNPDQMSGLGTYVPLLRKDLAGPARNSNVVNVGVDSEGVSPGSWNPVLDIGESGSQVVLAITLLRQIPDLKRVSLLEIGPLVAGISNQLFPGNQGEILKWEVQDDPQGKFRLSLSVRRSDFINYIQRLADGFKARSEVRRSA